MIDHWPWITKLIKKTEGGGREEHWNNGDSKGVSLGTLVVMGCRKFWIISTVNYKTTVQIM